MIETEWFTAALGLMGAVGWYMSYKHGEDEYESGFIAAIDLHSRGMLTYKCETADDGINDLIIHLKEGQDEE